MSSVNAQIAQAVVDRLNQSDVQAITKATADRTWAPLFKLEEMAKLQLTVYVPEDKCERIGREETKHESLIQIGLQKRLGVTANPTGRTAIDNVEPDALVAIAEYINTIWLPQDADAFSIPTINASVLKTEIKPLCDPDYLRDESRFFSLIHVTFVWG